MLLGKECCWAQDGHLFAIHHSYKRGAQGNLCLAKSNIAADETVHGLAGDHVLNHSVNGGKLVRRFFKAKAVGKAFVV